MDFFKNLAFKIRRYNIIALIISIILTAIMTFLFILCCSDVSAKKEAIGLGIMVAISIISIVCNIKNLAGDDEYKTLIKEAQRVGDLDEVGNMLDNMPRNFYSKSTVDLRFNEKIIFVSETVSGFSYIILPEEIIKIYTSKSKGPRGGWSYLTDIETKKGSFSIRTDSPEHSERLCEEMKNLYAK